MISSRKTKEDSGMTGKWRERGSFFFFQAEDGIRDYKVTGVQTCALPISGQGGGHVDGDGRRPDAVLGVQEQDHVPGCPRDRGLGGPAVEHRLDPAQEHRQRSEEHTSELQSPCNLVCRLLLEKKNKYTRRRVRIFSSRRDCPRLRSSTTGGLGITASTLWSLASTTGLCYARGVSSAATLPV